MDQEPGETYEPFDEQQPGNAPVPMEEYEQPDQVVDRSHLRFQSHTPEDTPPPQNDQKKLSKSELKDLKKKEKERERLEREAKKKEELRQKARKKNLASKPFKIFSLNPDVKSIYETQACESNSRSKDNHLVYHVGETIYLLLLQHEKLPPHCFLAEKEDGTVGFIASNHLEDGPPPGVFTMNTQAAPVGVVEDIAECLYEEVPGAKGGDEFGSQPPPPGQLPPPAVPAPRGQPHKPPGHHPPPSFRAPLPPENS